MTNPFSLAGKSAVITGGSRGIGGAVTRLLAAAGADVCIGYHSRSADADAMAAHCQAAGVKAVSYASDLGTAAGADSLIAAATAAFGRVDIVVHSAGIWPVEEVPVSALSDERWARTMRENVDATFYVSRAAVRAMTAGKRGGRLVLVSSTAGQRGEAMHADYGTSKGAMISFVKSLAVEVAGLGITVNSIAPGWVDTEMCAEPFANGGKERIAKGIPVGRVASADDIAFPIVSLCFDGARHVTGEIVNVNGGSVLCG
ncbi:MAG: SDR family NAD(P)-dependent oxidoreductase [Gemmatimonadetes bacterium]|nr:SDR family NAD(P)-dependent oxidoreductase [Gemmatimonadota bacterium]